MSFLRVQPFLIWGRHYRLCKVRRSAFWEALVTILSDLLLWIHGEDRENVNYRNALEKGSYDDLDVIASSRLRENDDVGQDPFYVTFAVRHEPYEQNTLVHIRLE